MDGQRAEIPRLRLDPSPGKGGAESGLLLREFRAALSVVSNEIHPCQQRICFVRRREFTDRNQSLDSMSSFEVQCVLGEDCFCIEVPTNCSVGDVLKKASEHSELKGASLWYSGIELNCDHLFADYFEPEGVYQVKLGGNIRKGTLLKSSESKVRSLGVNLMTPQLLMEMEELEWSMKEFWAKAGDFAPTLVLIKMKNETVCGGVAGVPWPAEWKYAADPAKGSFIFSLGATPARFDLVNPEMALCCCGAFFGFGRYGGELCIWGSGGGCGSVGQGDYAGQREMGQLVGGTAELRLWPYERWELWRL
jgi:hypothetical protein